MLNFIKLKNKVLYTVNHELIFFFLHISKRICFLTTINYGYGFTYNIFQDGN